MPKKILVVDDDPLLREIMKENLSPSYEVHEASDGMEALALAVKIQPDLVILDLAMPRMNGFELCRRLRADERTRGAAILVASSKSYANDIRAAKQMGAQEYLVKPFNADALLAKVEAIIGKPA